MISDDLETAIGIADGMPIVGTPFDRLEESFPMAPWHISYGILVMAYIVMASKRAFPWRRGT